MSALYRRRSRRPGPGRRASTGRCCCNVTVSGPVGKKGAIVPRFIVIEADTLPGGDMCTTKLYFATSLASKRKGGKPPVYEPENCRVGINDDGSDLVFPFLLNQGVAVIDDVTGEIISGPHDPILLQVLGGCP